MARKTREEKLQEKIDHLEDVLESLEHPSMDHIKTLHFNNKDEYFLYVKEYRGQKYQRLGLASVDTNNGEADPETHEIAARNDDGNVTAKYVALPDESLKIVKTLTKAQAVKKYEQELSDLKKELEDMYEPRVAKKALKAEQSAKSKGLARA